MSEIPTISVTEEPNDYLSNDENDNENDMDYDGLGAPTDIEDFDSNDEDDIEFDKKTKVNLKHHLKKPKNCVSPGLTDVESYNDSESEDEKSAIYPELKLSLLEFLDQGFTEEQTSTVNGVFSKTGMKSELGTFLNTPIDDKNDTGCLTDCERYSGDEDDADWDEKSIVSNCADLNTHMCEQGPIQIAEILSAVLEDTKSKNTNAHLDHDGSVEELSDFNESIDEDDDDEDGAIGGISEVEDLLMSNCEEEIVQIDDSDIEDFESDSDLPILDVTFISQGHPLQKSNLYCKSNSHFDRFSNVDENLTDNERLDFSNADESSDEKDAIPMARATISRSARSSITDVEDLDIGDMKEFYNQIKEISNKMLPPPLREITLMKEDTSGDPITDVNPLEGGPQGIHNPYIDTGLTDSEEISGDENDFRGRSRSASIAGPILTIENDIIENSESFKNTALKRNDLSEPEPITDVEELFMAGTARRKKSKSKGQSNKSKLKYLDIKNIAGIHTDVEELDISDFDNPIDAKNIEKIPKKVIPIDVPIETQELKTDVEYVTGDEDISDFEPTANELVILPDAYFSAVSSVESLSQIGKETKRMASPNLIVIQQNHLRRHEPDIPQCITDVEDCQMPSDIEDNQFLDLIPSVELNELLKDSCSFTHERCGNAFDIEKEMIHIKGMKINDNHTDVESIDEELAKEADESN